MQNDPTHPLLRTRNLVPAQTDPNTPQDCGQNCIKGRPSRGGWAAVWRASCNRQGGAATHTGWQEIQFSDVEDEDRVRPGSLLSRCWAAPPPVQETTSCFQSGYREGLCPSRGRSHTNSPLMCSCPFSLPVCAGLRGECTVLAQGAPQRADGRCLWSSTEIRSIQPT